MADDELSVPLGQNAKPKRWRPRLPFTTAQALAGVLGLVLAVCAGWALMVDDPTGGEPIGVVATQSAPKAVAQAAEPAGDAARGPRSYEGPGTPAQRPATLPGATSIPIPATAGPPPGTRTVTIIDGSTGQRQEVPIPASRDARAPVQPRLLETSRHGAIPRIGPDGARPSEVYARPLNPLQTRKDGPRIAIVITGMGVSTNLTQQAIDKLPGPITLAFPPYSADVERLVTSARADGHEILLQTPMEPFDYPDNDPGPQTLLTTVAMDQNLDRLHWLMSRFQGYVGIANYMGSRFTSTEQAIAPVLKEASRRGLIYFDDGSSPRSLAAQIAGANNLPFAKADVTLDAVPTPGQIDRALAKLEALARERGAAVGTASALPASVERIAAWAKAAEARGVVLVPITAIAIKQAKSS